MLGSLARNTGDFDWQKYKKDFNDHFGYGGKYVGYIDHATRDTLNNIVQMEANALAKAMAIPFDETDAVKRRLATKLIATARQSSGDELRAQVEQAVRITDNTEANVQHAFKMIDVWESISGYPGADDKQLPAIAKLPPLVALYAGQPELIDHVESAIKVTNNNDAAISFGFAAAKLLETAILTGDIKAAITSISESSDSQVAGLIDQALAMRDQSTPEVAAHFGMGCDVDFAVPSAVHNLATAQSYTDAVRKNIYSGGDSCGRSIIVGAVMGACYGVGGANGIPQKWTDTVNKIDAVTTLIDQL